jgi:DNA-binding CsgD family transcriptional regulator
MSRSEGHTVHRVTGRGTGKLLPTPSQLAILRHKTDGKTDETIARILGVADRTVRRQIESLITKLAVNSRAELFVEVGRRGWLDLDIDKHLPKEAPPASAVTRTIPPPAAEPVLVFSE